MVAALPLSVALNGYGIRHVDEGWAEILPWPDLLSLARLAERLGYEAIFTPEIRGREAFSTLAGFAEATERVRLVTGVAPLWSRAALTFALGASSLHEASGGRFVLGLGSDLPIDRTLELVEDIRLMLGGAEALMAGGGPEPAAESTDWHVDPPRVPIYLAALGKRMTRLAGRVADGVILNWCTPDRVAAARASVGPETAVCAYVRACLSHVDEHATRALKREVGVYVHIAPYRRQFGDMGLGADADAAAGGEAAARSDAMDRLIGATCVWGGRDRALARLAEYRDAGADQVVVYPVPADDAVSSITGTLMAAAPHPAVES